MAGQRESIHRRAKLLEERVDNRLVNERILSAVARWPLKLRLPVTILSPRDQVGVRHDESGVFRIQPRYSACGRTRVLVLENVGDPARADERQALILPDCMIGR